MYANVNKNTGAWEQDQYDFVDAVLVASSRSGATEVYKLKDGRLVQIEYYKSGNVNLEEIDSIPDNLTIRY